MVKQNFFKNLTDISRESSHKFENFFDWESYNISEDGLFTPLSLLSLYDTPVFDNLTPLQIRELSRLESIQVIYLYAYTESVMCLYLARHLVKSDFGSDEHAFLLREQVEEYRHQDMFLRGLEILGKDYVSMSRFTKWWTGLEALILPAKWFFLLQITIELISREVGRLTFPDIAISSLVRDLSLMHEKEEALHISFCNRYLEEKFQNVGFLGRTFGGILIALDIAFINRFYIYRGLYSKAGIEDDSYCYKLARKKLKENRVKNMLTGNALDFLRKYRWVTWANAWIFWIFTGITAKKIYGKNT